MGTLRVHVQSVSVESKVIHAVVVAKSAERIGKVSRAEIRLQLTIEALAHEANAKRIERVRDEALRYLDVASLLELTLRAP